MAEFDSKNEDGDETLSPKPASFSWMPAGCEPLADGEYDAIILGTGLTECIISGLMSVQGKRVLVVDRNNYYGAESASLSLNNLYEKFRPGAPVPNLGRTQDWNVDLIPKFIMSTGNLVKILLHTKVTRYLEWKSVDGSYVFKDKKIEKVPSTPAEALSSPLMSFFQKRYFRSFLIFVDKYERSVPATWMKGKPCDQWTMREVYTYYELVEETQQFVGHAMALQRDDSYLDQPADSTIDAIKLYMDSMQRFEACKSPYIYPLYGLGGLPEGFSRMCAINGGTFMLNKDVDEILFDSNGKAWGIKTGNEVAKAAQFIGDASYFPSAKTRATGKVIRSICLLDHPIGNTDGAESVQIIIPAAQVKRRNDIYVCVVSFAHCVASAGKYIAIVSTTCETAEPAREVQPGIELLGKIIERFDRCVVCCVVFLFFCFS